MYSYCGIVSQTTEENSTLNKNCVCAFNSFQDLERDINALYEETISLGTDFQLKSEAIQEWQNQVCENRFQVVLLRLMISKFQKHLEEIEHSLAMAATVLQKLDLYLKPMETVERKRKCSCNFDCQRYQFFSQFINCFNGIKSMKNEKFEEFVKIVNILQIICNHECILENIEKKIYFLEGLQTTNEKVLQYIKQNLVKDVFQNC